MKRIDAKGLAEQLSAQVKLNKIIADGPDDPSDENSKAAHDKAVREAQTDVVIKKLSLRDPDADA